MDSTFKFALRPLSVAATGVAATTLSGGALAIAGVVVGVGAVLVVADHLLGLDSESSSAAGKLDSRES